MQKKEKLLLNVVINLLVLIFTMMSPIHADNFTKQVIKMNDTIFWNIIEQTRSYSKTDEEFINKLTTNIEEYDLQDISEFEAILRKLIIKADHYNVMAAEKIIQGVVSDDPFIYFRCWLISQGKQVYESAINNPDNLAQIVKKKQRTDLEELLYVATNAYKKKTGKEEDETFPRDVCISKGLDYDMPKDPTKGKDWKEKDLPKMYPNLWKSVK
jgi:hypothetical protein